MARLMQLNPKSSKQTGSLDHDRQLVCCRYTQDMKFLFAAGLDGILHRWDLKTKQHTEFPATGGWIESMAINPQRPELYTADSWGTIHCWPTDQPKPVPRWTIQKAHKTWLRRITVSPDGSQIASCGNDHLVRLFSTVKGQPVRDFTGHESHVQSVVFSSDGKHLVSGDLHGHVKHWNPSTGKLTRKFEAPVLYQKLREYDQGGARSITFDTSGEILFVAGLEGTTPNQSHGKPTVVSFNWSTGKQALVYTTKDAFAGPIIDVAFHPAGYLIGSGSSEGGGRLWFWKPGESKDIHFIKHGRSFRGIGLHPDGVHLAATAFGSSSGQRGGNGRRLNKKGEYDGFGGQIIQYTLAGTAK